ncbi:MAG: helix-turn-helix domain-containing protein [archaeon]|nr:MAG: helix-turn-helix domain-containing protein [archaeon]
MYKTDDELELKKESLAKDIIGEIAMAADPSKTIKKWRDLFRVSQKDLSGKLGVTSSVISDYESGRRRSPGILFLKKYVESLIRLDEERGGEVLLEFLDTDESKPLSAAILDIREFSDGMDVGDFCRRIGAKLVVHADKDAKIYGYTLIDSVKAITELSFPELKKLYGVTTQRALIFTNITSGKGPMIAIKVTNLRPALIVLHNLPMSELSDVAKNIARVEGIPLSLCENDDLESFMERIRSV